MMTWWRHQMESFSALQAFVRGIHRWPVNSHHKGQWRGASMFFLCVCAWTYGFWDAGDLIPHRAHYDVSVMDDAVVQQCMTASQKGGNQNLTAYMQPIQCNLHRYMRKVHTQEKRAVKLIKSYQITMIKITCLAAWEAWYSFSLL